MAARRRGKTQMRTAREFDCKGCGVDLSAVPTKVANPFDADRKPVSALRSPPRVVLTFQFAGYVPSRDFITVALCDGCQKKMTFTSAGVPLMIDMDGQKDASRTRLEDFKRELQQLLKNLGE